MTDAWDHEAELVDENQFTKNAPGGWSAWNQWSPEEEFCDFAVMVVKIFRPAMIVETGIGQGYMTRRVVEAMPPDTRYRGYDTDHDMAARAADWLKHRPRASADVGHPSRRVLAEADLTILDSLGKLRRAELDAWWVYAKPGALLLTHDADTRLHRATTNHHRLARSIRRQGIPGVFLGNPRGGFFGQKPG